VHEQALSRSRGLGHAGLMAVVACLLTTWCVPVHGAPLPQTTRRPGTIWTGRAP